MTIPYQNPQAEQWRLMRASERAEILTQATPTFANLSEDKDKANAVFTRILAQAKDLDESQMLTGATGESNELYHQARGLTLVIAMDNVQKLPVLAQLLSALLTGNQVQLHAFSDDEFVTMVMETLLTVGISKDVVNISAVETPAEYEEMLKNPRLAQVAVVGTLEQVQSLSASLSQTEGVLTQVIAITDQSGLSEVFNPEYLWRFCTERVRTINTTAIGGNASLLELGV